MLAWSSASWACAIARPMRSMMSAIGTSSSASPGVMFRTRLSSGTGISLAGGAGGRHAPDGVGPHREVVEPALLGEQARHGHREAAADPVEHALGELEPHADARGARDRLLERSARRCDLGALQQDDAAALVDRREIELREDMGGRVRRVVLDRAIAVREHVVVRLRELERLERRLEVVAEEHLGRAAAHRESDRLAIVAERRAMIAAQRRELAGLGDLEMRDRLRRSGHRSTSWLAMPWLRSSCWSQRAWVLVNGPGSSVVLARSNAAAASRPPIESTHTRAAWRSPPGLSESPNARSASRMPLAAPPRAPTPFSSSTMRAPGTFSASTNGVRPRAR